MTKPDKRTVWLFISALGTLYFAAFLSLIFLIRPFWTDTNDFLIWALKINFNWVGLIICLSALLMFFHFRSFYRLLGRNEKDVPPPGMGTRLVLSGTLLLWLGMTILLLSELGRERAIIATNFINHLPVTASFIYLVLITLILPLFSFWQDLKLRIIILTATVVTLIILGANITPIKMTSEPYLQIPSEDSITVSWLTNRNARSWVEYGNNFEYKAYSQHDGLIDMNETVQRVVLTGLKPGTVYPYRVVSREIKKFFPYSVVFGKTVTSDEYKFKTLDKKAENASFLVLNDLHEKIEYWKEIVKELEKNPVDFIVINGDYFNDLNDERQLIDSLIKPVSRYFASEIPFIFVRGNHETRGILARGFRNYIALPRDKYYFTFAHGPLFMLALDAGEDKEDSHEEYSGMVAFDEYRKEETRWIREAIGNGEWNSSPWRIAFSHIPLNQFVPDDEDPEHKAGNTEYQKTWNSLLAEGKLNLMLSGHTHKWMIHPPSDDIPYPLVIGGGMNGDSSDYVVVRVDADSESIHVRLQNHKGSLIREYKIAK